MLKLYKQSKTWKDDISNSILSLHEFSSAILDVIVQIRHIFTSFRHFLDIFFAILLYFTDVYKTVSFSIALPAIVSFWNESCNFFILWSAYQWIKLWRQLTAAPLDVNWTSCTSFVRLMYVLCTSYVRLIYSLCTFNLHPVSKVPIL